MTAYAANYYNAPSDEWRQLKLSLVADIMERLCYKNERQAENRHRTL